MVSTSAARLAWSLSFLLVPLALAASAPAPSSTPAPTHAAPPAPVTPLVGGGTALFLDGLELGTDCRWSASVPREPGSCSDLVQNGCETDTDCGGRSCPGCGFGLDCLQDSDCQSGICYLGACDIAYQLQVTHTGGGSVTSAPAGIDCGVTCSALFDAGTVVTLTATPAADAVFMGWSGACSGTDPCILTVDQTAGVSAHFGHSLEVTRVGTGAVTSTPAGIACGVTCSGIFEHGTTVTLAARPANGSGSFFSGWTGDCAGAFHDCVLDVTAPRTATATFPAMTYNLVFVSSTTLATNLGSAPAYDVQCNLLATAAGLNNAAGNAYVAWLSSSVSSASARLDSGRGWVQVDGSPFTDTENSLITTNKVFRAIELDETGARHGSEFVMTGTEWSGLAAPQTCLDWTSTVGGVALGETDGGPVAWTHLTTGVCSVPRRIYCLGKTQTAALTPPATAGKKIWLSNAAYSPNGATTPNQHCAADQSGALALLARTTAPAANALTPAATYVRVDGQVVGTGAELIAAGVLPNGLWQHRNGGYLNVTELFAWTGQNGDLTALGTPAGTCNDWTSTASPSGAVGLAAVKDARWWNFTAQSCSSSRSLICVEP